MRSSWTSHRTSVPCIFFFFFFNNLFWLSLAVVNGGYSSFQHMGLLIAVAFLVVELGRGASLIVAPGL